MRTVLLIADLEGITGVETIESLVVGGAGYAASARRMTEEVAHVARLMLASGVTRVRISDAHCSGTETNLTSALLPPGCEVHVVDDLYGGALLEGVEAVACVGMHASGTTKGFGAHTVSVNTAWSLGGLPLSETHLVRWLAGERGVPTWFCSGDDVLEAELGGAVPFVRTKHSRSRSEARSLPIAEVERALARVLAESPSPLVKPPRAVLEVRFQRVAEAAAAEAAGATRTSPTTISLAPAQTFQQQYDEALRFIEAAEDVMLSQLQGVAGTALFARSASALLVAPWDP